jgi:hypothetical protein
VRKRRREAGRYLYRENRVRNIEEFEREREAGGKMAREREKWRWGERKMENERGS